MSPTLPLLWMHWLDPFVGGLGVVLLVIWGMTQAVVLLYALHRYLTLWRWRSGVRRPGAASSRSAPRRESVGPIEPPRDSAPASPSSQWPRVTVQLPVYNERRVVERLVDAVAALRYPRDLLEIQVLDDSTDETLALARRAAGRWRAGGVDVRVLHRRARLGYKAGALAAGLARARGEIIVVFDADFVPRPDFLERVIPHFADPQVGMVQGRWEYLNRGGSLLTRAQAAMLDSHFLIEHTVRMRCGLFFNFNGTAGAWRRACIESAGGWQQDTLTEDLDLSYRAQLRGWRFVFDPTIEVPSELPPDIAGLTSQQRRWAKGSVQTARKLLRRILGSREPARVKIEAFMHLTGNFAYPLTLALGLLMLPVLMVLGPGGPYAAVVETGLVVFGVAPGVLFLLGGRAAGGARGPSHLGDVVLGLVLTAGLSASNTRAVLEGLGARLGAWERTPKTGAGAAPPVSRPYPRSGRRAGRTELALAAYFAMVTVVAWSGGHARALPFAVLLFVGLGVVGWGSMRESLATAA